MTARKMVMTDGEIITDYRQAKDRNAMIQILADQNLCSRAVMREYLLMLGEGVPEKSKGHGGRKPFPPIDELRAMELYENGMDDLAIAEVLGETVNRVRNWRKRMHLAETKKPEQQGDVRETTQQEEPEKTEQNAPKAEGIEVSSKRWKTEGKGMPLFTLESILRRVTEGFPRAVIRKQGEGPVTGVRALVEYGESGQVDSVIVTLL